MTASPTMKVDAGNYEEMRSWFAALVPQVFPTDLITAESDPVRCLDAIAERSPAKARSGLAMAINDLIEATDCWPLEKIEGADSLLRSDGLPTLTDMRLRFSKLIKRVITRGSIKNDVEYYALRNAAELGDSQEVLWKLIDAYEARAAI